MSTKLSDCCISGHIHKGTPTGRQETIAGLDTYVAGDNKAQTVILLPDVFGSTTTNVKLVADEYAKAGNFRVLAPNFFGDDAIPTEHMNILTPLNSDTSMTAAERGAKMGQLFPEVIQPWLGRQSDDKVHAQFDQVIGELRSDSAVKKIGVVGYCWGGRHAILLAGKGAVDAAVANHPSFTEFPDAFEKVKIPTLIQIGDNDSFFPADQVSQVKANIFAKKNNAEIIVIPDAAHGFAIRNDQNNEEEVAHKEESSKQTVVFLQKHLV